MDPAELKKLAIDANGEVWSLLQKPALTAEEGDRMSASAFASLYLWGKAGGTPLHQARGHWLISRVMCVLNEPSLAAHHALLCDRFTKESADRSDFDEVYALEAQARAAAAKKDFGTAGPLKSRATQQAEAVKDPEDRKILMGDLHSEPWFGLNL